MKKPKTINESVLYDYWQGRKDTLTRDGKKIDIILIPNFSENTFIEMGNKGYLTGEALKDFLKNKKREDI